jgi:hypothetical protein
VAVQTFSVLRRPWIGLSAVVIALAFTGLFLTLDEFLYLQPYLVLFISSEKLGVLGLDLAISALSGSVISLSIFELRNLPPKSGPSTKPGMLGIFTALVAGACPCYYLVPLLAVAGGVGGVLGAIGIAFYTYQIPVKIASLALLALVSLSLERSLTASCKVPITTHAQ